ncbi:39S ribosomal protein L48, mitochondrial [Chelonus insularis]|uniref:39S ribosomal protein L48, mitochondrial n=1 Tax=Chelonus insularis TaxID=460826 RepID=UPI0015895C14|nr:39S ribosomal protein L48, mitochondrial [Chelonus insularis]
MFKITSSLVNLGKQNTPILRHQCNRLYSIYTPDYLDAYKPKIPVYSSLNVEITGYVFPVLESFQKLIHNVAGQMDFDVVESFALPPTHLKINRYKAQSTITEEEYELKIYERNLKLNNVSTTRFPIFVRILEATQPEGVIMNIREWDSIKEELRYIPDKELLDLKYELENFRRNK